MNIYNINNDFQNNYKVNFYYTDQENMKRSCCDKHIQGTNKKLKSIENTIDFRQTQLSQSVDKLEYRNERERRRVEKVNAEFKNLEEKLQSANLIECNDKENYNSKSRGLSKVKILRLAHQYIKNLTALLEIDHKTNELSDENLNFFFSCQDIDYDNLKIFY